MKLTITSVDYAPEELSGQVPLSVTLMRPLPSSVPNRVGAWLGVFDRPVRWTNENGAVVEITHGVLWPRWKGASIGAGARSLPVGVAYVVDPSLLEDESLDLAKTYFVALGLATDPGR
jgi:hypothetical protein